MSQIKVFSQRISTLLSILSILVCSNVIAQQWLVDSPKAYKNALKQVQPGDKIILANGVWRDFEVLFKAEGSEKAPITLTAQTKGKVILSGQSNLRLAGKYLVVSGLVFKDGYSPSSAVIAFRQNKKNLAFHSRVSEVVIDNFNNPTTTSLAVNIPNITEQLKNYNETTGRLPMADQAAFDQLVLALNIANALTPGTNNTAEIDRYLAVSRL